MRKMVIAALALGMGASGAARADSVIVLNSEEASYSVLSRGARSVYFVESSGAAARTIRKNLHTLEIDAGAEVIERDVAAGLRMLDSQGVTCDFAFLDPPYRKMGDYEQVLSILARSRLLNPGSQVVAEHDKHFDPGNEFGSLRRRRTLRQGDAVLSFYSVASLQTA